MGGNLIVIEHHIGDQTMATAYAHMWDHGIHVNVCERVRLASKSGMSAAAACPQARTCTSRSDPAALAVRITASLETIGHRISAHHGHYADTRANLNDMLPLLSNAADIHEHADDANRRLLKTIHVDEDTDLRANHRNPYNGLSIPGLQTDALTRAAREKKEEPGENLDQGCSPGQKLKPDPYGVPE